MVLRVERLPTVTTNNNDLFKNYNKIVCFTIVYVLTRSFKSCAFLVLMVGFVYGIFVPFGSNPLFMVIFLSL